ncbi:MAG: hypothetical protein NVSMB62_28190 [Acidobacteriaceae bacterium]
MYTDAISKGLRRVLPILFCIVCLLPGVAASQTVRATGAMRKVKTTTGLAAIPTGTSAAISAAKNEFEAFQIVIQGPASNVNASASSLVGPGTPLDGVRSDLARVRWGRPLLRPGYGPGRAGNAHTRRHGQGIPLRPR